MEETLTGSPSESPTTDSLRLETIVTSQVLRKMKVENQGNNLSEDVKVVTLENKNKTKGLNKIAHSLAFELYQIKDLNIGDTVEIIINIKK